MAQRHSITRYSFLICAAGLALNLGLSKLVLYWELPLFLDSVGTILAAILGGYLPGIIVGFGTNVMNGMADPITLYYSIISILFACAAAFVARRGWFSHVGKAGAAAVMFALIGGGLGSGLTWLLYGFGLGSGVSAPYALELYQQGFSIFWAQLLADLAIDLADKLLTVLLCCGVLRLLPAKLLTLLSSGRLPVREVVSERGCTVRHSLRSKVVWIIAISAIILSIAGTVIGCILYTESMTAHYEDTALIAATEAAGILDGERICQYVSGDYDPADYATDEAMLQALRDGSGLEYAYVYRILPDGCHVVFDIDTPELPGSALGDVVPFDADFAPYLERLLAGAPIPPIVSRGAYGWLLTAYVPIPDAFGVTVAYAAADISMAEITRDLTIFIVKMASLLFGVSMVIVSFALWFAERRLVDPINEMALAAADFAYDSERERLTSATRLEELNIRTGDEIENLYGALRKTVLDVSNYISDISKKNRIISQMQHNIIISFANMVENRDNNTGQHIKHTAAYVEILAHTLSREGPYAGTLTEDYIQKVTHCAPLHDLGKIVVPDAILNKPGRLTAEEFEQMKAHTTAGRSILLGILENSEDPDYLSEALNMAASHHERWDGTGYPDALRGDEIPLSARIMAVADVFDALISKRSYKDALPIDRAYEIICEASGTQFDPAVVAAFCAARAQLTAASE